ncbi:MAG: cation-translocating P-type ATPase C-terminal domain-containing protein [Oscillospiraceae bacterium]|nr:cation-translocating P-type ATPase C-terminal domain-containing protein [Oscillospiraceae bacterium]
MPAPLLPIHLLLVNLVTDALPAMALGTEPKERDIMRRRPIPPNQSLFAGGLGKSIPLEGCLVGLLALAAFTLGCTHLGGSLEVGRSMCFATLSLSELVHALNMRSDGSAIKAGLFKNWWLNGAIAFCAVFQILIISIPALAAIFSSVPLDMMQWMVVGGLSLTMLIVIEGVKLVFSRGSKSV